MSAPTWRLDWLARRLSEVGGKGVARDVGRASRKELRALDRAYRIGMFGRMRRAKGAAKRAGAHGALAVEQGRAQRKAAPQ